MKTPGKPNWLRGIACLGLAALSACSNPARPPQPPAPPAHLSHDEIVRGDLASLIAVQGLPCGTVVEFILDERMRYRVICETGDSYRIRVSAERRVTTEPHAWPDGTVPSPAHAPSAPRLSPGAPATPSSSPH